MLFCLNPVQSNQPPPSSSFTHSHSLSLFPHTLYAQLVCLHTCVSPPLASVYNLSLCPHPNHWSVQLSPSSTSASVAAFAQTSRDRICSLLLFTSSFHCIPSSPPCARLAGRIHRGSWAAPTAATPLSSGFVQPGAAMTLTR